MRFSKAFIHTLKEAPSDAEVVSHRLMLRAGMIRKVASGIYNFLPLGLKVLRKVEDIIREEMNKAGAHEVFMPVVIPSELWKKSGRWDIYGKELLRIKDRHERDFCLGPTHEEVITDMVRREVSSYRQLPINLYQIQTKFRDEIRPRYGLMRGREFIMKDAYSFHRDEADAEREYMNMYETYSRIFERCGLRYKAVEAETGPIGGKFSHEFMVLADTGEDILVECIQCGYAANVEKAECRGQGSGVRGQKSGEKARPLEKVATPKMKSVEEVSEFLNVTPDRLIKTLIYETGKGTVAVLVRGDHEINESKLKHFLGTEDLALAGQGTIEKVTNAPVGFAGPVGLGIKKVADYSIKDIVNGVTGANEKDVHLINVNIERDFKIDSFSDIRFAVDGDPCPSCEGNLKMKMGIEVGHIFKLGTKYSQAMGATFLDEDGKYKTMIMGCYGIGVGRTVAAAIEQNHDEKGIIWPIAIAPYQVLILQVNPNDSKIRETGERLYKALLNSGIDTMLDDRDERPGVKFFDADLIGFPLRITVGPKVLGKGFVELKERSSDKIELLKLEEAAKIVKERVFKD